MTDFDGPTMFLRSAPASPFCHKVRMIIEHLDLTRHIVLTDTDPRKLDPSFLSENPLGKIPALILPSGQSIVDSRVIAAFLDDFCGGERIIPSLHNRFSVLHFEALADGIMDAIVLIVYERRWRPEDRREATWVAYQQGKVERGLAYFEQHCALSLASFPHVGDFALAAALSYLDLRFDGDWRSFYPGLVTWLDDFSSRVPAFEQTRVRP